jgi:NaMN:DMB phosphoribosyltransferase
MMPVALGMIKSYTGNLILAGGTQMLAVAALSRAMRLRMPWVVTTCYVRDDPTANVQNLAEQIQVQISYVDPEFGSLGHPGLARYCIGEVKEGFGAGGAMCLAYLLGYSPDTIRNQILSTVNAFS